MKVKVRSPVRTRIRKGARNGYLQPMIFLELEKINNKMGAILILLSKMVGEEEE